MANQTQRSAEQKKLCTRVAEGLSEEERCDILLSLTGFIDDGHNIGWGPEDILLDADNGIQIAPQHESGPDLLFQPPEVIRGVQKGTTPALSGPEQAWFLLGMLAYFMYYGADYYTDHHIRILEAQEQLFRKHCVIAPAEAARIPFGKAVSQLTAVEPAQRVQGLSAFLSYLSEQMPETAKIRYLCGGQVIHEEERVLRQDIENLAPTGMLTLNGTAYQIVSAQPVQIPYRPGTHQFEVEVTGGGNVGQDGSESGTPLRFSPRNRWLYLKQPYLTGEPVHEDQMLKILRLSGGDAAKQLELYMKYPDSQLSVFRLAQNGSGEKTLLRRIQILRESDPQMDFYLVSLRYTASDENLWITVKGQNGTFLHNQGVDLRSVR